MDFTLSWTDKENLQESNKLPGFEGKVRAKPSVRESRPRIRETRLCLWFRDQINTHSYKKTRIIGYRQWYCLPTSNLKAWVMTNYSPVSLCVNICSENIFFYSFLHKNVSFASDVLCNISKIIAGLLYLIIRIRHLLLKYIKLLKWVVQSSTQRHQELTWDQTNVRYILKHLICHQS